MILSTLTQVGRLGNSLQPVVLRKHGLGLWDTDMSRYFIFRELLAKHSEFFTLLTKKLVIFDQINIFLLNF